jgi:hypothetical protein
MDQDQLWRELKSLPPSAQREVMDFIAFLRERYKPFSQDNKSRKTNLADEPFLGMWRNRKDLADSSTWVRNTRKREWNPLN